jgi:hypothetical protein
MLKSREAQEMTRHQQDVEFHPRVILSQSSSDLVGFVHPDSCHDYGSTNIGSSWIEFRFCRGIRISGVRITSAGSAFP